MGNALQMANYFHETGYFSASEPDFMVDSFYTSIQANFPNDLYFNDQWGLSNTGQYCNTNGIDINFCNASQLTFGNSNVIIAVIDQGLEMNHPDMTNIYSVSYDTENDMTQSNIYGPHGTACAGIIGANPNNEAGISGIAPSCQIMSISNELVLQTGTKQKLANGINFAWQNGAHVISNSWGHDNLQSSLIDDAINNAFENGRNGKGSIVVFSAGNNNSSLIYPANSNPNILTVGAISPSGKRKSPNTCDTENWGSNYGDELDIVAPGVLVPTIDRQGNEGYNPNIPIHRRIGGTLVNDDFDDNDYTIWFNGTSAACPHVSSVAGLILSFNHSFTQKEIADIIESSSQKVGGYNYQNISGRPNDTWNNEMGYGLLDACRAIMEAIERGANISGNTTLCTSSKVYSLGKYPTESELDITWSATPSHFFTNTSGTGSSFSTAWDGSGSGMGTITATLSGDCGSVDVSKNIWVGKPGQPDIIFPFDQVMEGGTYQVSAAAGGVENYDWSVAGAEILSGQGTKNILIKVYCGVSLYITVKGVNSCGESPLASQHAELCVTGEVAECYLSGLIHQMTS
jgi:subtilisin family serine protease